MNHELGRDPIDIPRGSTLRIDDGAGVTLDVRQGELWLTEEGGREDHFLRTGDRFGIRRNGVTLVHAFRDSVVCVAAAMPRKRAESFGLASFLRMVQP